MATVVSYHSACEIEPTLLKFWEPEELPTNNIMTNEELRCEEHFAATHSRTPEGRYIVRLPFKENSAELGVSRAVAVNRLKQVERRLVRNPVMQEQYNAFLSEYLQLGHMKEIPPEKESVPDSDSYYLPHHAVLKESSSTTKLRVVFDGSSRSSTGVSLNDKLMVGPKLQDDIFPLLIRFRGHRVPLCADIEKMYRQIIVHESDRDYQRIVWRDFAEQAQREYQLCTVTYGMASSPYLATKCLQQLVTDEGAYFSKAATVASRDFFVDDLISGADSVDEAIELQQQLISLLRKGGFELRKWASSEPEVLKAVPSDMRKLSFL